MKLFTVREGAEAGISIEGRDKILSLPLGHGMLKLLTSSGVVKTLRTADIAVSSGGPKIVREARAYDKKALVLVETCKGVGGRRWLTANVVEESMAENQMRVVRYAKPFEESVGCEVVCRGDDGILVQMLPGSSFRICRDGKLEGAPPELVVLWRGVYDPNCPTGGLRVFPRNNRVS